MKIVIATPLYPPDIGGPATYAALLSKGLIEKNHTVSLVKFGDVRHLPKLIRHVVYYCRVAKALKNADMVLALDPVSVGLPACIAARRMKKPLVLKVVGDYAWEQGTARFGITASLDDFVTMRRVPLVVGFLRFVQRGVTRHARAVIVPSEYLKKIVSTWGIQQEKVYVIYNAVHGFDDGTVPEAVVALPRPLVLTAGRLVPWKHMDEIITAVALARKSGTPVSLAIIGDGDERHGLEDLAKEKLKDNYCFAGTIAHSQLLASMRIADVFVLASSYEGLSHVLIEALWCGTPIIATQVGGNEEVLADYEGGTLIPEHDIETLADAIEHVVCDKDLRVRLQSGAPKASERFSQDTMFENTIAALTKAL